MQTIWMNINLHCDFENPKLPKTIHFLAVRKGATVYISLIMEIDIFSNVVQKQSTYDICRAMYAYGCAVCCDYTWSF